MNFCSASSSSTAWFRSRTTDRWWSTSVSSGRTSWSTRPVSFRLIWKISTKQRSNFIRIVLNLFFVVVVVFGYKIQLTKTLKMNFLTKEFATFIPFFHFRVSYTRMPIYLSILRPPPKQPLTSCSTTWPAQPRILWPTPSTRESKCAIAIRQHSAHRAIAVAAFSIRAAWLLRNRCHNRVCVSSSKSCAFITLPQIHTHTHTIRNHIVLVFYITNNLRACWIHYRLKIIL